MFAVSVKQCVAVIYTNNVVLVDNNYSCVNDMMYKNDDINFIDKVR